MINQAKQSLQSVRGVILDATFSSRLLRDRLRDALGDRQVSWLLATVDDATARKRLVKRASHTGVVSDARLGDQAMLDAAFEAPDELPANRLCVAATDGRPAAVVRRLLAALACGRRR